MLAFCPVRPRGKPLRVTLKMTPDSGIFEGISWSVSRLPCLLEVARDAGSDRDRADMDVAVMNQPALFASVVVAAAREGGHECIEASNGRPLIGRAPGEMVAPL
jgi:hypothetical protein